jgi:hypothetical protein
MAQQQEQQRIVAFQGSAARYIAAEAFKKFPDLSVFTAESLAKEATDRIVAGIRAGRGEQPLDQVLADIQNDPHVQTLIAGARTQQRAAGETARPSERGGAAQAADHDPGAKPKTVTNRQAASSSRVKSPDDMTEKERDEEALRQLRAMGFR